MELGCEGFVLRDLGPNIGHILMWLKIGQLVQTDPVPVSRLDEGGQCVAQLKVQVKGVAVLDVIKNNLARKGFVVVDFNPLMNT